MKILVSHCIYILLFVQSLYHKNIIRAYIAYTHIQKNWGACFSCKTSAPWSKSGG
jgi:hypothetical protein